MVVGAAVVVVDMLLLLFWLVDGFGERGPPYIEKGKKKTKLLHNKVKKEKKILAH